MNRARFLCTAALIGNLALAGCESNRYEIELTPKEETLQRDLTTWREAGASEENAKAAFPADELKKIAAAYNADVPAKLDKKHNFSKAFAGKMPDDVGGEGWFLHWKSSLGTASVYVERFRGNDDLLADVETRLKVSDRLVDLLIGWLATELEGKAGFPALRKFLDEPFRRDVKNLCLQAWHFGLELNFDKNIQWDFTIRAAQYLAERGYFARGIAAIGPCRC